MEIKRLEVDFTVKAVEEDDNFFHIMGFANTWDIDLGDDRSIRGCFLNSIKELEANAKEVVGSTKFKALMPALWQHDSHTPAGVHVELREEDGGLFSHSIYPKDDTFVTGRIMPQVRVGSVRKQSIGYRARKVSFEEVGGNMIRNLEEVQLMEASLVTFPMNTGADITDIKTDTIFKNLTLAPRKQAWDAAEASKRVTEFEGDQAKAFFYKEDDASIQFADVVEGKLVAVPKGIFAAAAEIGGGTKTISEKERATVSAHINRYYEKMDLESPFTKNGFRVDDFSAVSDPALLEKLFRDGVKLSRSRAKELSSIVIAACGQESDDKGQRDADEKVSGALDELLTKIKR